MRPPRIVLVLVRPQEQGNVGATARAMANFGLDRLRLVEPAVEIGATARAFAVHAGEILDRAERHPDLGSALAGCGRVVATTAARDRAWPDRCLSARELPAALAADPAGTESAIVFGPEPSGLTNDELALASLLVTVPGSPAQPTLNLSQAVLVVCYELFLARSGLAAGAARGDDDAVDPLATADEIEQLGIQLRELLGDVGFARDSTIAGVERDLRRLVARAVPSRREVRILRGILRRTRHALARRRPSGKPDRPPPR